LRPSCFSLLLLILLISRTFGQNQFVERGTHGFGFDFLKAISEHSSATGYSLIYAAVGVLDIGLTYGVGKKTNLPKSEFTSFSAALALNASKPSRQDGGVGVEISLAYTSVARTIDLRIFENAIYIGPTTEDVHETQIAAGITVYPAIFFRRFVLIPSISTFAVAQSISTSLQFLLAAGLSAGIDLSEQAVLTGGLSYAGGAKRENSLGINIGLVLKSKKRSTPE